MEKHFLYFMSAGVFTLLTAGLFYLAYRPESMIIKMLVGEFSLSATRSPFIGIGSIPSFLHTLAFCLLTAAFAKLNRINIIMFGIFWFLINVVYELFSLSDFHKHSGIRFYGDIYDVMYSFLGTAVFIIFSFLVLRKNKHTY